MSECWQNSSLGKALLETEIDRCKDLVPSQYYANALQVGLPRFSYLRDIEIRQRFIVDTGNLDSLPGLAPDYPYFRNHHYVVSGSSALPFPERSHSLVVLPHTLDFSDTPHEVLRQVTQVLEPEGCLVIIGFNQLSFYGGFRLFRKQQPWNGKFYRIGRVQDWISLLGYDLVGAGMIAYRPPLQSLKWRNRLEFLEKAGDRWWPGLGGVYMIVGRKREIAVAPRTIAQPTWRRLLPGIAQPASQRAARTGLKLVVDNQG